MVFNKTPQYVNANFKPTARLSQTPCFPTLPPQFAHLDGVPAKLNNNGNAGMSVSPASTLAVAGGGGAIPLPKGVSPEVLKQQIIPGKEDGLVYAFGQPVSFRSTGSDQDGNKVIPLPVLKIDMPKNPYEIKVIRQKPKKPTEEELNRPLQRFELKPISVTSKDDFLRLPKEIRETLLENRPRGAVDLVLPNDEEYKLHQKRNKKLSKKYHRNDENEEQHPLTQLYKELGPPSVVLEQPNQIPAMSGEISYNNNNINNYNNNSGVMPAVNINSVVTGYETDRQSRVGISAMLPPSQECYTSLCIPNHIIKNDQSSQQQLLNTNQSLIQTNQSSPSYPRISPPSSSSSTPLFASMRSQMHPPSPKASSPNSLPNKSKTSKIDHEKLTEAEIQTMLRKQPMNSKSSMGWVVESSTNIDNSSNNKNNNITHLSTSRPISSTLNNTEIDVPSRLFPDNQKVHVTSYILDTLKADGSNDQREVKCFELISDPRIVEFEGFLSDAEIDFFLELAEEVGFLPSKTSVGAANGSASSYSSTTSPNRTSYTASLRAVDSPFLRMIERRAARFLGLDARSIEPLTVLRYHPGQQFKVHHDGDFRTHTMLIYLNDVDGGETEFPALGFKIAPKKGRAAAFPNSILLSSPNSSSSSPSHQPGSADLRTLHAGLPVTSGVKYCVPIFFNKQLFE